MAGWEFVSSRSVQFASGKGREYFYQIVKASEREKWRLSGTLEQRKTRCERLTYFLPAMQCSKRNNTLCYVVPLYLLHCGLEGSITRLKPSYRAPRLESGANMPNAQNVSRDWVVVSLFRREI